MPSALLLLLVIENHCLCKPLLQCAVCLRCAGIWNKSWKSLATGLLEKPRQSKKEVKFGIKIWIKIRVTMAKFLSWLEHHPIHQKVAGSIPNYNTYVGHGLDPQPGHVWEAIDGISFSLPSSLLKIKHILRWGLKHKWGFKRTCPNRACFHMESSLWSIWERGGTELTEEGMSEGAQSGEKVSSVTGMGSLKC